MSALPLDQTTVTRVCAEIERSRAELVRAVSDAVRIPSVNPTCAGDAASNFAGGERAAARFFASLYREIGCEVDVFAVREDRENAVGVLRGAGGGRSLIFNGHIDVQPPGEAARWTHGDAFSGHVDGSRVWGRGAADMKGGVVSQAFAVRAIVRAGVRLAGDVILEAVVGEESGEHDIGIDAVIARGYVADAAIVAEPAQRQSPLAIAPASCGMLAVTVKLLGKATHSCNRGDALRPGGVGEQLGVNAIDKGLVLIDAIRELEREWVATKRHELYEPGAFTIDPGAIRTATNGAEIERMEVDFYVWYHPDEYGAAVRAEIEAELTRACAGDSWLREHPPQVSVTMDWPPFSVPPSAPICRAVAAAHERAAVGTRFAGAPPLRGFVAVEDATYLNGAGITAINYGPGDIGLAHAYDEHVLIDELVVAARTYAVLGLIWCGQGGPAHPPARSLGQ
jgi:acetylornithine deacetylase